MAANILTFGITDLDCYPICKYNEICKEFVENDILCLPYQKPDIEVIDSIYANVCIKDFKLIKTIQGYKVIVKGTKRFKIMYTADTCDQSIHSAQWECFFCEFILISEECYNSFNICVHDVFIGIEDIVVKYNDNRIIDVSLVLVMYPIFAGSNELSWNNTSESNYCTRTNNNPDYVFDKSEYNSYDYRK